MRLFLAVDLPEPVRQRLAVLGGGVPGARWIPPENLHLTLRFIGEVDGATFEDIVEAMAQVRGAPFDLALEGVGHFETARRPRMLWAGVAPSPPLRRLRDSADGALQRIGLPPEGRKYTPHVTLARLKDAPSGRVQDFLAAHGGLRTEPFPVTGFTLYSSFLSRTGALYRAEAGFPFEGGEAPDEATNGATDEATEEDWNPWHTGG